MTRHLVPAVAAALLACASGPRAPAAAPPDPSAELAALGDAYLARHFAAHPESATFLGWPGADHGAVTDVSPAAIARWHAEEDALLARARALDPRALELQARRGRAILVAQLEGSVAARPCREELWSVSSIGGWQVRSAELAAIQPVGTPELRGKAVERLRALGPRIDAELENLRRGLALGYVASRENVDRAVEEIAALLATPPGRWPLVSPAERDRTPGFREALSSAVADVVVPAARRYHAFLVGTYRARARSAPGVAALPDGAACYAGALQRATTLPLAPEEVHRTGLAQVERLEAELARIAARSFGTRDVPALLARLRTDRAFTFRDGDQILDTARAAIARAQAAAPRWFATVARAPVEVRPFPPFLAASAPVDRYSPRFEGGRMAGGIFWTSVFEPQARSRAELESIAFHEAVPGHHFQFAVAAEGGAAAPLARYAFFGVYIEGWALYAERLADEMGLYSGDLERLGQLASESLRAARLVVDTGMHALGWERQRAVDYLLAHTTLSPAAAGSEIDRYAAWPGQATSYLVGALELRRLRGEAERALGPRFDVRAFHTAVLAPGKMPLGLLRDEIARFVEARQGAAAAALAPAPGSG